MQAKILWIWKYNFYGEWFDVVYGSGKIFSYTLNNLPQTAKNFIISANAKEVTFVTRVGNHGYIGEVKEQRRTLYYKNTNEMPPWLVKKL